MTDMIGTEMQVLKTDEKGRVRTPAKRREKLLNEFERSGLSGRKFADLVGVKYQTFAAWAQRRRRQRGGMLNQSPNKSADPVRWLEAVVAEAQSSATSPIPVLKIHLTGGAWLEIEKPQQVPLAAALLRSLQQPC